MDAALFVKMLSDKNITDLKKLGHKYPQADMTEFVGLLKDGFYRELPLKDFQGKNLVVTDSLVKEHAPAVKLLAAAQTDGNGYGVKAMEEEISSSFTIEQIDFSRDSVRKIFSGLAPEGEDENRIYGMKQGMEFISDRHNTITAESLSELYQMAIGAYLPAEDRLLPGHLYRHDDVFVVGEKVEHTGLPAKKLPGYMDALLSYIQEDTGADDLSKAAVIHFYLAFLHPYFDGNGRMARLLHLWFLAQRGYSAALFVPLSSFIEQSRKRYYDAYTLCERNASVSGVTDVTPFLNYFSTDVYSRVDSALPGNKTTEVYRRALENGTVTEKEKALWQFVLSAYGESSFSTKQLEKDFGNAAYATIRGFVLKFEGLGLLRAAKYGNRVRYSLVL